jgi:predicted nucleotidyltransferase
VRIDAQSLVGGYPALQMRRLVRTLNDRLYWGLEVVPSFLHTSEIDASRVVAALEAHGLARARRGKGAKAWTTTQLAQSFACATAAKPITRRTAEAALAAFLERVQRVNRDDLFLAKVTRVIVFGSYLQKDLARLGDVDIAVELEAKALRGETLQNLNMQRVAQLERQGRRFRNVLDRAMWWQTEVLRFLKGRSRSISLHDYKVDRELIDEVPYSSQCYPVLRWQIPR